MILLVRYYIVLVRFYYQKTLDAVTSLSPLCASSTKPVAQSQSASTGGA